MKQLSRRAWLQLAGAVALWSSLPPALAAQRQRRRRQRPALQLKVKEGDPAPDAELTAVLIKDGRPVKQKIRLSQYKGKKNVVLYFFPKASTPG